MRKHALKIMTTMLLLTLITSFGTLLVAQSQGADAAIQDKLKQLQKAVSDLPNGAFENVQSAGGRRDALVNKIEAVTHQIRAGAFNGALNKLQTDVKKTITNSIKPAYAENLIRLVDEIINLIKGITPPTPQTPDFTITAFPNSIIIPQNSSSSSVITVDSLNNFTKPVNLSITSATISGVIVTFSQSLIAPSPNGSANSTLTVKVASTTITGNYTMTISGTSDTLQHSVEISLKVTAFPPPSPPIKAPDFSIATYPISLSIHQGGSNISIITVTSLKNFSQPVNLTVTSSAIAGLKTTINPTQVIPPSNKSAISLLTIDVAATATIGSYKITVAGTNGTAIRSANVFLIVTAPPTSSVPDFSIVAFPQSLNIQQGSVNMSTVIIASLKGFSAPVELKITSQPIIRVKLTLSMAHVTLPANGSAFVALMVEVNASAPPGRYAVTIVGSSGSLSHSTDISLRIVAETSPPVILSVLRVPTNPNYNDTVNVLASVIDVESGVRNVVLSYSGNVNWTNTTMALNDGLYSATIPPFSYNTTGQYRVYAYDNAGNLAVSILYSYKVIDSYPPLIRIDRPAQGSYLSGTVAITALMRDQDTGGESGLGGAQLSINGSVVKMWQPPIPVEPTTYNWNTVSFGPDGGYVLKLSVRDKAGNVVEKSLTVIVDNTQPTAVIEAPVGGSFTRLLVHIEVTGSDANFDKMEVLIDGNLVKTSVTSGTEEIEWNTRDYDDGVHTIMLIVYDNAGNTKQAFVTVTVDNAPPSIGTPTWSPIEPQANEQITINVNVTEPSYGAVQNVTLLFRNKTLTDWKVVPMIFTGVNWTTTLNNQSNTKIDFKIMVFDRAGNSAESQVYEFNVEAQTGVPLSLILLIILILAALIGASSYLVWRRTQKRNGAKPTPITKPPPPLPPPAVQTEKLVKPFEPVNKAYQMVSFVVPAHNEEDTISKRITYAYERAAYHVGPSEIIVVDDGSQDGTYESAWAAIELNRKQWPNIPAKVVKLSSRLGKEEAVRVGRRRATGEIVETVNGTL